MNTLSIREAGELLGLQDSMNRKINSDWLTSDYPFLRAVVVEVGEALDHYGWKWWKKQSIDLEQVQIELIDVLHFMLSSTLVRFDGDIEKSSAFIVQELLEGTNLIEFDGKSVDIFQSDIRYLMELLAGLAVSRRSSFKLLERCFHLCNLSWAEARQQYLSKNVLNIFRQDHGYKEGTYNKIWAGEEDNVHLAKISSVLLTQGALSADALYTALEAQYKTFGA